jgi:hypothetical protein
MALPLVAASLCRSLSRHGISRTQGRIVEPE